MHVTTKQLDEALTQVNNLLKELYQRVDALESKNNGRTEPKRKVANKPVEPTSRGTLQPADSRPPVT